MRKELYTLITMLTHARRLRDWKRVERIEQQLLAFCDRYYPGGTA